MLYIIKRFPNDFEFLEQMLDKIVEIGSYRVRARKPETAQRIPFPRPHR